MIPLLGDNILRKFLFLDLYICIEELNRKSARVQGSLAWIKQKIKLCDWNDDSLFKMVKPKISRVYFEAMELYELLRRVNDIVRDYEEAYKKKGGKNERASQQEESPN